MHVLFLYGSLTISTSLRTLKTIFLPLEQTQGPKLSSFFLSSFFKVAKHQPLAALSTVELARKRFRELVKLDVLQR